MEIHKLKFYSVLLFISIVITGCTVKLISAYDEVTDNNVTALQRKFETFLIHLESKDGLPECAYAKNINFYETAKVDLSAIQVRAAAIPKNDITNQQIELLKSSLDNLEALHKLKAKKTSKTGSLKCISADEIKPLRIAFNASFTAILKLELAKKRGDN